MEHRNLDRRNAASMYQRLLNITVLFQDAAKALEKMHNAGVIHKDVKASNLYVNQEGKVVLGDYGSVELLGTGKDNAGAGTWAHMSFSACSVWLKRSLDRLTVDLEEANRHRLIGFLCAGLPDSKL